MISSNRSNLEATSNCMLIKSAIDQKVGTRKPSLPRKEKSSRELVEEYAARNEGKFDLADITAELDKFLAEHRHSGRSARQ